MAKVITFSRNFPATHPKAGLPTLFVEKILKCWVETGIISLSKASEVGRNLNIDSIQYIDDARQYFKLIEPKLHTIRAGKSRKVGEKFSPRVWTGKPYASKQLEIAPEMEWKTVLDFDIEIKKDYITVLIDGQLFYEERGVFCTQVGALTDLAKNDGLGLDDFKAWFGWCKQSFEGQLLSWVDLQTYNVEPTVFVK